MNEKKAKLGRWYLRQFNRDSDPMFGLNATFLFGQRAIKRAIKVLEKQHKSLPNFMFTGIPR
jgi:hypothetical protein